MELSYDAENEFIGAVRDAQDGRKDCINGVSHKEGRSAAYDRGFSEQYAIEQQQGERTK